MENLFLYLRYPFWKDEYKFYTWSRKIVDEVFVMRERNEYDKIKPYLIKVIQLRKRFLRKPYTEWEKMYLPDVEQLLKEYNINY